MLKQRGSPEAVAWGFAIGMFVTFSPTVGFQIPLSLLLATLLNGNRLAATIPIWLTNVFTVPPVYSFTYKLGAFFLPPERALPVRQILDDMKDRIVHRGDYSFGEQFRAFAGLGGELFYPMLIGGALVGLVGAAISYPLVLRWVRRHRLRRSLRLQQRAAERRGLLASTRAAVDAILHPHQHFHHPAPPAGAPEVPHDDVR